MVENYKQKNERLHGWVYNHTQFVNSPLKNHHVNIRYNTKGEVIKTQKLLIQIKIRELFNILIKPPLEAVFCGTRSESGEVIIGDTLLRKYICLLR